MEIYVDDLLIYQGILRQHTSSTLAGSRGSSCCESVLFTSRPEIIDKERGRAYVPSAEELVAFFDETGRVDQGGKHRGPGLPLVERPTTALVT